MTHDELIIWLNGEVDYLNKVLSDITFDFTSGRISKEKYDSDFNFYCSRKIGYTIVIQKLEGVVCEENSAQ